MIALQKIKHGKIARHVSDCLEVEMEFHDYLLMTPIPNCDRKQPFPASKSSAERKDHSRKRGTP
jgi:hypothetical protein